MDRVKNIIRQKRCCYIIEHFGPFEVEGPLTDNATRAASVNASLTPRLRLAEHSIQVSITSVCSPKRLLPRYRRACIRLATASPVL
jgi:hypothetical protein